MSTSSPVATPPRPPAPRHAPPREPGRVGAPAGGAPILEPMRILRTYYPWFFIATVLGVVLGIGTFFVWKSFWPRWDGKVYFEVSPAFDPESGVVGTVTGTGGLDELETYMATQIIVIEADYILNKALDDPGVRNREWMTQFKLLDGQVNTVEALKELRDIVNARIITDTQIIRLSVATPIAADSAAIANAISAAFLSDNRRTSTRKTTNYSQNLHRKILDLRGEMESTDANIATLLGGQDIESLDGTKTEAYLEMQALQPRLVETRESLAQMREQLQQFQEAQNSPGGVQYPESIRQMAEQSPITQRLDATLATLRATRRALQEEFGPQHREYKRTERMIRAHEQERAKHIEETMSSQFSGTIESLQSAIANLMASERQFMERNEEANARQQEVTETLKTYKDLETDRQKLLERQFDLENRASNLDFVLDQGGRVRVLRNADTPDEMSSPQPIITVVGVTFLTIALVGGVVVLKELREQRVRTPQDVAMIPRTRVLGIVPEIELDPTNPARIEMACEDQPSGAVAEAIRSIRTSLLRSVQKRGHTSLLVFAGMPGSGASSVVSNLAVSLGAVDQDVLVIDANMRRPAMHTIFGVSDGPGLAEVLSGDATLESAVQSAQCNNVRVLSAGRERSGAFERFTTGAMAKLIEEAQAKHDVVLVDVAPAVVSGDAMVLAGHCDASMMVVRAFNEKRGLVARLRRQIGESKAEFLGVVVNAVKASAGGYFKRNFEESLRYQQHGKALTKKKSKK